MIKSLHIENWQSHKDTTLNFCDGVNVITGVPNSGKTAILRALLWLIENRPSGASQYMPTFAGDKCYSRVEITLDDDVIINLEKSLRTTKKGEKVVDDSIYKIIGGTDKIAEFAGMGGNVPDQIAEALNFDELNIQRQLDSPFVLSSSAGEIARLINRITHLENVDIWISSITTKINTLKQKGELLSSDVKELETRLEQYKNLPELEKIVKECKVYDDRTFVLGPKIGRLDKHIENLIDSQNKIGLLQTKLKAETFYNKIIKIIQMIKKNEDGITLIKSALLLGDKIRGITHQINECEPMLIELQRLRGGLKDQTIKQLKTIIQDMTTVEVSYKEKKDQYTSMRTDYMKAIKDVDICPIYSIVCPVKDDMIKNVKEDK